jgi:hypothetical protein
MYSGYIPFYSRPFGFGYPSMGYGYPAWGFPGYAGYNSYNGINAIGSAISNQSLINTGSAIGITQTSTPTVIW